MIQNSHENLMGEGENDEFLIKNVFSISPNEIWYHMNPNFNPFQRKYETPITNKTPLTWFPHPPLFTSFG